MVKNKKKAKEAAIKAGGALKDILIAAATHPTTAAIAVMGICTLGQILNRTAFEVPKSLDYDKHPNKMVVYHQLGGLYNGAQTLGAAAALAPVAIGALGVVKEGLATRKAGLASGYP